MLTQKIPAWDMDAFEPLISSETMYVHVHKLHKGYVDKLNSRFASSNVLTVSPSMVLRNLDGYLPVEDQEFYRNMMGGNLAHSLFWQILNPKGSETIKQDNMFVQECLPKGTTLEDFKATLVDYGLSRFGSGWVWGCVDPRRDFKLYVYTTKNHDTPYMRGQIPIFNIDLWEHAYFMDVHGDRKKWLETIAYEYLDFKLISEIYEATKVSGFDVSKFLIL